MPNNKKQHLHVFWGVAHGSPHESGASRDFEVEKTMDNVRWDTPKVPNQPQRGAFI